MAKSNILFVAMGGSAGQVIARLKRRFGSEDIADRNIKFLYLDVEEFTHLSNMILENIDAKNEYLYLGGKNPRQYVDEIIGEGPFSQNYSELMKYFNINNRLFLETIPNTLITTGAMRKRSVGRLLLYMQRHNTRKRIIENIRSLKGGTGTDELNIVLVSGCCGGTGSSIFYDILRLVHSEGHKIYPVIIGPSLHTSLNQNISEMDEDKTKMNAFAFFEELSAFLKFPEINFSFYANEKQDKLEIPYFIFFDDCLSPTKTISVNDTGQLDENLFYNYVSDCLSILFASFKSPKEKKHSDNVWQALTNAGERTNEIFSYESSDGTHIEERAPFISFGYYKNISKEQHEHDLLSILINNTLLSPKENILQKLFPDIYDNNIKFGENIRSIIQRRKDLNTFFSPMQEGSPILMDETNISLFTNKLLNLQSINEFWGALKTEIGDTIKDFEDLGGRTYASPQSIFQKIKTYFLETNSQYEISAHVNYEEISRLKDILEILETLIKNGKYSIEFIDEEVKEREYLLNTRTRSKTGMVAAEKLISNVKALFQEKILFAAFNDTNEFKSRLFEYINNNIVNNLGSEQNIFDEVIWLSQGEQMGDTYASIRKEESESGISTHMKVGLNQRSFAIWKNHGYAKTYYSRDKKKYYFFPHMDRQFDNSSSFTLLSENDELERYMENREAVWRIESTKSEITSFPLENLLVYGILAQKQNWENPTIIIKGAKISGQIPGMYIELNLEITQDILDIFKENIDIENPISCKAIIGSSINIRENGQIPETVDTTNEFFILKENLSKYLDIQAQNLKNSIASFGDLQEESIKKLLFKIIIKKCEDKINDFVSMLNSGDLSIIDKCFKAINEIYMQANDKIIRYSSDQNLEKEAKIFKEIIKFLKELHKKIKYTWKQRREFDRKNNIVDNTNLLNVVDSL